MNANAPHPTDERKAWDRVRDIIGADAITLGPRSSAALREEPTRVIYDLTLRKFAAKMIGQNQRILEYNCGEGLGVPILPMAHYLIAVACKTYAKR